MATLVDVVVNEVATVGFDNTVSAATVLGWVNRRHQTMVRRSRVYRGTTEIGPTVANTAFYVASTVLELFNLTVGGIPAGRAQRPDAYAQTQGELVWSGEDGASLYAVDASGVTSGITLIPTPTASGLSILAYGTLLAPTLTLGQNLLVPDEYVDALAEGAIATGLARDTEQVASADRFEQRFDAKCEELRAQVNRSLRPGPAQIRVQGFNA